MEVLVLVLAEIQGNVHGALLSIYDDLLRNNGIVCNSKCYNSDVTCFTSTHSITKVSDLKLHGFLKETKIVVLQLRFNKTMYYEYLTSTKCTNSHYSLAIEYMYIL